MDIDIVIKKYFPNKEAYNIYHTHVQSVAYAVMKICDYNKHLEIDKTIAVNGALLHDIGICMVDSPDFYCYGFAPYIQHGIMGRLILEDENLHQYALICERHIGTGLYKEDVIKGKLPLPLKDMIPISMEEIVVAYADKFFSKSESNPKKPKKIDDIRKGIAKFGENHLNIFDNWCKLFGYEYLYDM